MRERERMRMQTNKWGAFDLFNLTKPKIQRLNKCRILFCVLHSHWIFWVINKKLSSVINSFNILYASYKLIYLKETSFEVLCACIIMSSVRRSRSYHSECIWLKSVVLLIARLYTLDLNQWHRLWEKKTFNGVQQISAGCFIIFKTVYIHTPHHIMNDTQGLNNLFKLFAVYIR